VSENEPAFDYLILSSNSTKKRTVESGHCSQCL